MAEDPNTLMLFVRLGLSFGMVLGLVAGVTWVLRRRGLLRPNGGNTTGGRLEVLDRKSLGKSSSLVLARVGGTAVLLGVTGERIEVLSDRPGLDAAWRDSSDDVQELAQEYTLVGDAAAEDAAADHTVVEHTVVEHTATAARTAAVDHARTTSRTASRTAGHRRDSSARRLAARPSTAETGGARRTGLPMAAPAADRTRMSFVEALQELTVRRS